MITKISELQIQIIINNNLYKKGIIDENTYSIVNEKLVKMINSIKVNKDEL